MGVFDPEEASEDGLIDENGTSSYKDDKVGLVDSGSCTYMTAEKTKEVDEVYQAVKSTYISSYTLKAPYFITHGFKENKETHKKLFKNMYNFG